MSVVPTTVDFPAALPARRVRDEWRMPVDGIELKLSNLDKPYWQREGYTKADLLAYYLNVAPHLLPALRDRPLTLKRMPDGADGEFFYAKQAPPHTPAWVPRAAVVSRDSGKAIDYLLAQDTASLLYVVNLGCIEFHPWHSRVDDIGHPDYAFFDLDPMGTPDRPVGFDTVREVALLVRTVLDGLGLRGYPRTSGATGIQIHVPIDRVHTAAQVREWVGRACRLINRADPDRTTMEWSIADRPGRVFLDHNMNTEGKNIAAAYSLRPERGATVATPLTWEEVAQDVEPGDFTIATIWARLAEVGDLFPPVLQGGQDLRAAMAALGMDPDDDRAAGKHEVRRGGHRPPPPEPEETGDLGRYTAMRDFSRTPEPAGDAPASAAGSGRFVIQHHLATRLHHDLRLERGGTARSWALPKGLPAVPGRPALAVQTEDHPISYMSFSGEIPRGEYGAGPVRIWDEGTYDTVEWIDGKVTFVLHGRRHSGEWHLFRTDRDWLVTRAGEPEGLPPPPPVLAPMLATDGGEAFDDDQWLYEVKWDGVRAVATVSRPGADPDGSTSLVSRQGNDLTPAYPEIAPLWERVLARNAVLDGELVLLGPDGRPSFQLLQHRMHLRESRVVERARRANPVTFMVFDLLAVDGDSLVDRPLHERLALLDGLLVPGAAVQRSAAVRGAGVALFDAVERQGLEGVIAKRADSCYRPGKRSRDWLKIKVRRTVDVVIGGWLPGEGNRAGRLGSLLAGLHDDRGLHYVGRVGTGFDAAELDRLHGLLAPLERSAPAFVDPAALPPEVRRRGAARWISPTLVCTVEFGEFTDAGRLRAPSYKGLAPGVDPRECLLEDLRRPSAQREG
ncbi:MAG: ATP-dependent DNA ligase [Euzebyaceae bacterium]|nr:ATP-dependent DNA ligase [Euzebyaceae bacterium]